MSAKRGLTLVEVIVVIGLLGILVGLFLPPMCPVRENAKRAACKSYLRQVGIALHLYADDFKNAFPTVEAVPAPYTVEPGHTVQALQLLYTLNYTDNPKIFSCASSPSSYNKFRTTTPLGAGDEDATSYAYDSRHTTKHAGPVIIAGDKKAATGGPVSDNHGVDGGNFLAIDGSVQWVKKPNDPQATKLVIDPTIDDDVWSLGPPRYVHDTCLRRTAK